MASTFACLLNGHAFEYPLRREFFKYLGFQVDSAENGHQEIFYEVKATDMILSTSLMSADDMYKKYGSHSF